MKYDTFMTDAERNEFKHRGTAVLAILMGAFFALIGFSIGGGGILFGLFGLLLIGSGVMRVVKTYKQQAEAKQIKRDEAEIRAYQLRQARGATS